VVIQIDIYKKYVVFISLISHSLTVIMTCKYNETPGAAPRVLPVDLTVSDIPPFKQGILHHSHEASKLRSFGVC
jgi:hypothetical protein